MLKLNNLFERINSASRILLITHENPDGDALGSTLALSFVLKNMGKSISAVCVDANPQVFSFLPKVSLIKKDFLLGDFDLIFILDCGDLKRTGYIDRLKYYAHKRRKKIINIDHHPKNDVHKIAWYNLVDYQASSTSEIVYKLLKNMRVKIDQDIATCLLCGLYTDTGSFKHSNTSPTALNMAGELLNSGAKLKHITKNVTNGKTVPALKIWGVVLSRIQRNQQLGLVTSIITQKDLQAYHATGADLAGAVNLINAIPDTRAAILFSELENGKIKASIRTERNDVDVSQLAAIFDGGGLRKASGFTIDGKLVQDKNGGWKIMVD
ncbi:MAG: bifunctional oligoribonuclease/PAP phosphatase NrnA [Patescibacteria group bacterium]|nr:bifunctional oligoribonuclease/PAP phosphatase NrnA [Patescibacteria group bacterium]